MTAEIQLWKLFGNFTDDVKPTYFSLPNTAVFQKFTHNLLCPFLSLQRANEQHKNSCVSVFDSFLSGFFGVVLSKPADGNNKLTQLFHVTVLMFKRIFGPIFDPVHNFFHEFCVWNFEVLCDFNLLIKESV